MSPLSKKLVDLKAELTSEDKGFAGYIKSFSPDGIYIQTLPTSTPLNLAKGQRIEVKIRPDSGEPLCLNCRVKWSYKTPPHGLTDSIEMEVIEPPVSYSEFFYSPEEENHGQV